MNNSFWFHGLWRFRLADAFPMEEALSRCRDARGRTPVEKDYDDSAWDMVTLPHTFNGRDLFAVPIEDAGSGQKRTCAFYRNTLRVPEAARRGRVILSFEGVRQTCYVYVNGRLAGYAEMGVGPFGFDLTPFLEAGEEQSVAVATDNTATRGIPFCIAETPALPGAVPGSFLLSQDEKVDPRREGVGFFWNCNDFNPSLGGLAQPVRVHFKPPVHLTLPLYANLLSHGTYVYATDFDLEGGSARVCVRAEVRNQSGRPVRCRATARVLTLAGIELAAFASGEAEVLPSDPALPLSMVPEDAYRQDPETGRYIPRGEDEVRPTRLEAEGTQVLELSSRVAGLVFWEPAHPALYRVEVTLEADGEAVDTECVETGFRQVGYDRDRGVLLNGHPVWLRGYAQRSSNEWAASGIVPEWVHDLDMRLVRESGANHIRWMHVAASLTDVRACDRQGVVITQPAGDKERETTGRQWDQRVELMRNVILAGRNHPSILFWEAGNNVISPEHMREMRLLREVLDPCGGRFMGCRTLNTEEAVAQSEYVGTMLNRHAARFMAEKGPVTETEYSREEAPRRVWDDYSPPDYDYRCRYLGEGGKKQKGLDFYDLTSEDLALANARGYSEFFFDRVGGASGKSLYSACAALCWTDSAQHGRQSFSENGRMSGRVDAIRVRKQSFDVFRVMHSAAPAVKLLGHWNYPPDTGEAYRARAKRFNGTWWEETDEEEKRDAHHKTVYAIGSYAVKKVVLLVNGREAGVCEKPLYGFVFAFPGVDITLSGTAEALGYGYDGSLACSDRLETAGEACRIRLKVHVSPEGWRADGADLCLADIEVTDREGRVCPLEDRRLDVEVRGPAVCLGGYNSGRFNGNGRHDSVAGEPFVYAECGTGRVILRSRREAGRVTLRVTAEGLEAAEVCLETLEAEPGALLSRGPCAAYPDFALLPPASEDCVAPIPEADRAKYVPEKENYCKIMVDGQEPDFRGVRAVNRNGSIWGNVLCILERMKQLAPDRLSYVWDRDRGTLTLTSGGHTVRAAAGESHLAVDGQESLMDGMPYVTPSGILVMEVSALAGHVEGVSAQFDGKIGALRIEMNGVGAGREKKP